MSYPYQISNYSSNRKNYLPDNSGYRENSTSINHSNQYSPASVKSSTNQSTRKWTVAKDDVRTDDFYHIANRTVQTPYNKRTQVVETKYIYRPKNFKDEQKNSNHFVNNAQNVNFSSVFSQTLYANESPRRSGSFSKMDPVHYPQKNKELPDPIQAPDHDFRSLNKSIKQYMQQ